MNMNSMPFEKMAKLRLTEEDRVWVTEKMDMLTEDFSLLDNIDTAGVEPLITVLPLTNVLRDDVSYKNFDRAAILSNAPEQYDGYFQVPKTID